jgi:hypothetical protein
LHDRGPASTASCDSIISDERHSLPDDVETPRRLPRIRDAGLGRAGAQASSAEALIAHPRLAIEKMRRELHGQRAERKARLLGQMEFAFEELEAAAVEDEFAAGKAAATSGNTTADVWLPPRQAMTQAVSGTSAG